MAIILINLSSSTRSSGDEICFHASTDKMFVRRSVGLFGPLDRSGERRHAVVQIARYTFYVASTDYSMMVFSLVVW